MNDTYIVTGFVLIDDLLVLMGHQDDCRTHISASKIMRWPWWLPSTFTIITSAP